MKELIIHGINDVTVGKYQLDLKGPDWALKYDVPIYCPIVAITLEEIKQCGDCEHWLPICQHNPAVKSTDCCSAWKA